MKTNPQAATVDACKHLTLKCQSEGPVRCVAFTPDGKVLASGGCDWAVRLWEVATGKELAALDIESGAVWCLAFSPDGKTLAAGTSGFVDEKDQLIPGVVELWNVAARKRKAVLKGHGDDVMSVAFAPDGRVLASASGGEIKLWDLASRKARFTCNGGPIAFSPDGRVLASGTAGQVRLWDAGNGKALASFKGGNSKKSVQFIGFMPDGKILAAGWQDTTFRLYDATSGKERAGFKVHHDFWMSWALTPDGRTLAVGSYLDGGVKLYDVATGKELATLNISIFTIEGLAFSPDGKLLAACGGQNQPIEVWQVEKVVARPAAAAPETSPQLPPKKQRKLIKEISSGKLHPKITGLELASRVPCDPGKGMGIFAVAGNFACLAGGQQLTVFDISNPVAPQKVGSRPLPGSGFGIAVTPKCACVIGDKHLWVVDISNPAAPLMAGTMKLGANPWAVAAQGDYAYITDGASLRVVDITKPQNPRQVGVAKELEMASGVAVSGKLAYVTADFNGLHILDVSNSQTPKAVGRFEGPGNACQVTLADSLAAIADEEGGFWLLDVADPTDPQEICRCDDWAIGNIAVAGNYVFASGGDLDVFDISKLRAPKAACSYHGPETIHQVLPVGDFIYAMGETVRESGDRQYDFLILRIRR